MIFVKIQLFSQFSQLEIMHHLDSIKLLTGLLQFFRHLFEVLQGYIRGSTIDVGNICDLITKTGIWKLDIVERVRVLGIGEGSWRNSSFKTL